MNRPTSHLLHLAAALALLTAACGDDGSGSGVEADASASDTSADGTIDETDASAVEDGGSEEDGGTEDAGTEDGGSEEDGSTDDAEDAPDAMEDSGTEDTRPEDTGTEDATTDTGEEDTGTGDAGVDAGEDVGTDAGAEDTGGVDVGEDVGEPDTGPDPVPGLCATVERTPLPGRGEGTRPGAESPYPAGQTNDVILGALEDPDAVEFPVAPGGVNIAEDLETVTYDVYVPPGYDGSEPYGLVAFINSGNSGGGPNGGYRDLFESERLIQIAPDGAGNPVNIDIRMGRAYVGTLRAMELFNIDETRVYAMGNSGGARTSHMLSYQYPELYTSAMPRCGANYPREVDQDYETREPDSHYEFWGEFFFPNIEGVPYIDFLRTRERNHALMASFGDFREGDIMNIYHNGMEEDGLNARLIETTGGHCSTNTAHFYDAMGFISHPLFDVIDDAFDDGDLLTNGDAGSGVRAITEGVSETDGALVLDGSEAPAAALLGDRIGWYDWSGLVFRTDVDFSSADGANANIVLWPFDESTHADAADESAYVPDGTPSVFVGVTREGDSGTIRVVVQPATGEPVAAFVADFDDWRAGSDPIDFRIDAWDRELQIDTGWHLQEPSTLATGALRLNDRRTIRIRWDELLGDRNWTGDVWAEGAVITFSAAGGTVGFDNVSARDAAGYVCE